MKQVILITGASSGFGRATALALVAEGHIVYGTSRKVTPSNSLEGVMMLDMDISKRETIDKAVAQIISEQGHIDVLINNAGVGTGGALELTTDEEYDLTFNTNVRGLINMCRAVVPFMRKQSSGKIINISSIAGILGIPYQGLYSGSKFAIEGLSEAYALELKKFGIKICLVEPGDFATGFTASRVKSQQTIIDQAYSESFDRCMKIVERDEQTGANPTLLARRICKLVKSKRPPFRSLVGNASQVIPVKLIGIIPTRLAQYILRKMYSV